MKILYYSPHPGINAGSPSGYATHIREVISAFREAGHEVEELIMGGAQDSGGRENPGRGGKRFLKVFVPGIVWETLKDLRLLRFDKASKLRLEEAITRFKPDLIYERAYYCCNSGILAAAAKNTPIVLEVNAPFPEEKVYMSGSSMFLGRAEKVEKQWLVSAKRVIVVSSALKEYLVKKGGNAGKIMVLPNSVAPEKINVDAPTVAALKAKHALAEGPVIGFVGSVFPYHGVDLLIKAFAEISNEYPAAKLMVVGDGYVIPALKDLAAELDCGSRVIFTGNVPHAEVFNYISLFDIAVMARSNWYGSPVKIFEYGALGKAMVVPDTVPVRDAVEDGNDGLVVESSKEAISAALRKLLGSAELRSQMGQAFRNKVLARYTWQVTARKSLEGI